MGYGQERRERCNQEPGIGSLEDDFELRIFNVELRQKSEE
jgi:hypothetical protein